MSVNVKEPMENGKEGEKFVISLLFTHTQVIVFFSVCEVARGDECKQWPSGAVLFEK